MSPCLKASVQNLQNWPPICFRKDTRPTDQFDKKIHWRKSMRLYLQGQLQVVFDALYELGVIEPVLHTDWSRAMTELPKYRKDYERALEVINNTPKTVTDLIYHLKDFSPETLGYVAMEVGKEFVDYQSRTTILH